MNKLITSAVFAAVVGCTTAPAEKPAQAKCCDKPQKCPIPQVESPSLLAAPVPFKLGMARYTMCQQPFDRAIDLIARIDCHYMGLIEGSLKYDASDAEIAAYKAKLAKRGIEVVSAGPEYYKTEEQVERLFAFAKRYGMKYVSVVPYEDNPKWKKGMPGREARLESDKMLDALERCVKKYDIRAAIHNHGPDNAYLYPTAEAALKRVGNRDKRIGVCLDVGHERRAGLDPVEFIRKHGDRVYEIHLKNIKIDPVKNFAKEGPRGELDIPGIFKALADNGFDGYCLMEYEKDYRDNELPIAESFGYYRGIAMMTKGKLRLAPVPANANTLSAEERAEGYQLLFDGKNLPKDLWVGEKEKMQAFPKGGWYVENGALFMKPKSGIYNGKWFPLPPEDAKLGGGGSICTVKKYGDFCFKFDFRLTEAANSGVKYFYNEDLNKSSCEEYQILDKGHPDYDKANPSGVEGTHRIAALYDLKATALADKLVKPLGQWNSGMVVSKGNHVEHWLNGVKVLEYERGSKEFRDWVAKSKYLPWQDKGQFWGEARTGRIHLQDHSDSTVYFCNLKIKEL